MTRVLPALLFSLSLGVSAPASQPQERLAESVLPALAYGPACWSSLDLQNLGDRPVIVEVEAHRASGALVPLVGHPQVVFHLNAGERASYRLEIQEGTGDAWVRVREQVPSPRLWPVVAVAGTTECVANNQLRTTSREVAYPARNPWFSGEVSEMPGNVIALVNTSERPAKASVCYSAGNLYSVPGAGQTIPQLTPVCSHFFEVQVPPFGARQFPVERDGNSYFSLKTEGTAIVLEMLRPVATGVKIYTVDSTIKFQQ
jgi:hypothetical protein